MKRKKTINLVLVIELELEKPDFEQVAHAKFWITWLGGKIQFAEN